MYSNNDKISKNIYTLYNYKSNYDKIEGIYV